MRTCRNVIRKLSVEAIDEPQIAQDEFNWAIELDHDTEMLTLLWLNHLSFVLFFPSEFMYDYFIWKIIECDSFVFSKQITLILAALIK